MLTKIGYQLIVTSFTQEAEVQYTINHWTSASKGFISDKIFSSQEKKMDKYRINFEKEFDILDEIGVPTEEIEFLRFQKYKERNAERWD